VVRVNLGDIDLFVDVRLAAARLPRVLWHIGPASPRPRPLPPVPSPTTPPPPHLQGAQFVATLKADQKLPFTISGVDEVGNPVPLDGPPPVFAVDNPGVLTLAVAPAGFSGEVAATGMLGTTVLSVSGATASGLEYTGSAAVDVIPGDVAGVAIAFGAPSEVTPDV
jgi:hypothetical protein